MTDQNLDRLFARIQQEATRIQQECNLAIDKLMPIRQSSLNGRKQKLSYVTKKLEVIVGACNRAKDKING